MEGFKRKERTCGNFYNFGRGSTQFHILEVSTFFLLLKTSHPLQFCYFCFCFLYIQNIYLDILIHRDLLYVIRFLQTLGFGLNKLQQASYKVQSTKFHKTGCKSKTALVCMICLVRHSSQWRWDKVTKIIHVFPSLK